MFIVGGCGGLCYGSWGHSPSRFLRKKRISRVVETRLCAKMLGKLLLGFVGVVAGFAVGGGFVAFDGVGFAFDEGVCGGGGFGGFFLPTGHVAFGRFGFGHGVVTFGKRFQFFGRGFALCGALGDGVGAARGFVIFRHEFLGRIILGVVAGIGGAGGGNEGQREADGECGGDEMLRECFH